MFFGPLKALLKAIATLMVLERADVVTEVAPIVHWLFCKIADELTGFSSAPIALSHSSWIVPWFRSYTTKQELAEVSDGAIRMAAAERLAALWLSEKTKLKVWPRAAPPLRATA